MTTLVTGATGTVGRQVVEQLLRAGERVRALTRDPAAARQKLPGGVEVVGADLTNPATVAPTLEGVTAMHLINFGGDDAALETGPDLVELALKAGVRRATVLMGGEKGALEKAVEDSRLEWTLLQPVEFMANALEWAEPIRSEGVVREPFLERRSAMVHEADIGAVAAVALTQDGHGGQTYPITGPEVLTVPDKIAAISAAIGREVELVELTEEQARARWRDEGHSEETIEFFVWVYRDTPPIGYTVVPTVEEVTGRPARTFAQWATEHADSFRR